MKQTDRMVIGGSFTGVNWPGREADHSLPSSAEVKNAWSYTFTPSYVFMAWCFVKQKNNFTFILISKSRSRDNSVVYRWATG
jgi:hypothetical protein